MALEVIAGCNDGGGRLIPAGPRAAASAHEDRVLALGVLALGAMEGEDEGMDLLRTFARPMLATSFVLDGIDAMTRPARHAERFERATPLLERAGLPPMLTSDARMLTRACGAVSVMAGLGLATGTAPRICAAVLAGLNIPLTLVNNPVWAVKGGRARDEALSGLARGGAVESGARGEPVRQCGGADPIVRGRVGCAVRLSPAPGGVAGKGGGGLVPPGEPR